MSLKERLDKKKKKYLQKLAGKEGAASKRITISSDEASESHSHAHTGTPTATRRTEKVDKEKEVWKYEGETNAQGEYHGVGKLSNIQSVEFYEGQWHEGQRHGFGTQLFATGERYQGAWKSGQMDGMGVISFPTKDTFTGQWEHGNRVTGSWTFTSNESGAVFTEHWVNGAPGPVGELKFSSGGVYTGEVAHALVGKYSIKNYQIFRSGYGEMKWKDGTRYIGGWKKDKRKGFGVLIDSTGETYYGEWQRGKRSGFGMQMYTDGTYYEGQHLHDEMKGKGKMCVPSGDVITGEWENSRVNNAQFFKGQFQTAPRPVREIFIDTVLQIAKDEEKAPFISTLKWTNLIPEIVAERQSLSLPKILNELKKHRSFDIDQTSISERMGLDVSQPVIVRLVNRFIYLFIWEYGEAATNKKPNKRITYILQSAVDDVNSFLACVTQKLAEALRLAYEDTKQLYERLMLAIFTKIYDTIFPLYIEKNSIDDALAEAKRSELSDVTTKIIGVKKKYLLESAASDEESASLPSPPAKLRTSNVRKRGVKVSVTTAPPATSSDDSTGASDSSSLNPPSPRNADGSSPRKPSPRKSSPRPPPNPKSTSMDPLTGLPTRSQQRRSSLSGDSRPPAKPGLPKPKRFHTMSNQGTLDSTGSRTESETGELAHVSRSSRGIDDNDSLAALPSESAPILRRISAVDQGRKRRRNRKVYRHSMSSSQMKDYESAQSQLFEDTQSSSPIDLSDKKNLTAEELDLMKDYIAAEVLKDKTPSMDPSSPTPSDIRRSRANSRLESTDLSENSLDSSVTSSTADMNDPRRTMPYWDVIHAVDKLERAKSPIEKLRCLSTASQAVLLTVDAFYKDKSENILMGAEDKFPVLIYALIHSTTKHLYSHARFLADFVNRHVGDMDREFLVSNIMDALKYIRSLEWQVRDPALVLVPVKLLLSNISWAAKGLSRLKVPDSFGQPTHEVHSSIIIALNTIFRHLSARQHEPYSPYRIPSRFDPLFAAFTSSFFERALGKEVGLKVVLRGDEDNAEEDNGENEAGSVAGGDSDKRGGYFIEFVLKHPLYIYARLAEVAVAPGSVD